VEGVAAQLVQKLKEDSSLPKKTPPYEIGGLVKEDPQFSLHGRHISCPGVGVPRTEVRQGWASHCYEVQGNWYFMS
jgi:hypothetical protein